MRLAGLHPSDAARGRLDIILTGETKATATSRVSFAGPLAFNTLILAGHDTGTAVPSHAMLKLRRIVAIAVSRRAAESGLVRGGTGPSPAR